MNGLVTSIQSPSNPGVDSDDDELLTAAGRGHVEILKMLIEFSRLPSQTASCKGALSLSCHQVKYHLQEVR
jgi:hypothetical protein